MPILSNSNYSLIRFLGATALLLSVFCGSAVAASTATESDTNKKNLATASKPKITIKKKNNTKASDLPITETASSEDEKEPDVQQSNAAEYKCELGNSLTMYSNKDDDSHLAMRWKKRLYRLTRVETTTGAHRFENRKAGFVWIGIPTKALLLDSIRGHQLANECKTAETQVADAQTQSDANKTK